MKRKNSGFTLLEVMLAIAILSMVMSMVYTILISTIEAKKYLQTATEVDRVANRLIAIISKDLQAAYIYQLGDKKSFFQANDKRGRAEINFVTNNDSLVFEQNLRGDFCEVGYSLKKNPDESNMNFLIRREDFFIDRNPLEGGQGIRLYDRIASFNLTFYNRKGKKSTKWDSSKDGLPSAVIVKFAIPEVERGAPSAIVRKNLRSFSAVVPLMASSAPVIFEEESKDEEKDK